MSLTENNIARRRGLETTSLTGVSTTIVAAMLSGSLVVTPIMLPRNYAPYTINEVSPANRISKIDTWTDRESYYQPRTVLGKRLLAIRSRAISKGLTLLDSDEIMSELYQRQGDII